MRGMQWRWAAFRNGLQDAAAYRIEFFFEILGSAAIPVAVQLVLWYAMFKIGGAETVAGMTYSDLIAYTLASALFSQVRGGDLDFELQEMVRTGTLSNYILRPAGVVEFIYIRGSSPRLFVALLCLLVGIGVGLWFGLSPLRLIFAMMLALLGNIIHYQLSSVLATTAFYWEEAYSVLMVKNLVVSLLSGELIPLTFFPESATWIWKSTPFYLYVFGPTQIALGHWSVAQTLQAFGIAAAWIFAGTFLIRWSWGIGLKRYVSLGG